MKVVLVGIYYPMAILRYVEQALRRRVDVELFTMGPHTGTWIPWNGGMNLPMKYSTPPDLPLPRMVTTGPLPISMVETSLPWKPDVWIHMNSTWCLRGKPQYGKNIIVGVDPHCVDYNASRGDADLFFCMQTPYMHPGDLWLPYAFDPIWHRKHTNDLLEYDTGLVGAQYEGRVKLVEMIKAEGHTVLFPGYGPVYEEYHDLNSKCRTGFNLSTQQDLCARVFELMGMGICPIVNRVPDLQKVGFIEGTHYLGFDTLTEAVEQLHNVLKSDAWYDVGEQASVAVRQGKHTWDDRVAEILSYV